MFIYRTTNWAWVREFLIGRLDSIGCGITEKEVEAFGPMLADRANWFVVCWSRDVTGLVVFKLAGRSSYEVHAAAERKQWGYRWVAAVRSALRWFFENNREAKRLWTYVLVGDATSEVLARVLRFRRFWKGAVRGKTGLKPVWWFEMLKAV